jgi:hypothetical protein
MSELYRCPSAIALCPKMRKKSSKALKPKCNKKPKTKHHREEAESSHQTTTTRQSNEGEEEKRTVDLAHID